ncbi:MAG: 4Fe-4S dicluster domain-containing protein [Victivallaceae bacterium]|nr:4Fe-4S dicluster domain-containing protein [Victivallaceae bacterium]
MPSKKHEIVITADECKGCGRCILVCPMKLIAKGTRINVQGYVAVEVAEPQRCIGCGSCFYQCPEPGAITIYEEDEK